MLERVDVVAGSSPHARGLRGFLLGAVIVFRIIPARAGFTRFLAPELMIFKDHPRTRGVY